MLRSVHSSPDTHTDHVRHLLDQRINRLDPDDNFSALSQFTDTPSVYSPAHFSPSYQDDRLYSPRQRLNDPNLTNLSILDLERDPRYSLDTDMQEDDTHSFDDADQERPGDDHSDADSRLSYLGPKMRFHSRAPWEMEDGIPEEESEPADSPKHHAFSFSLGAKSVNHSSRSSSPRPSFNRPSGDSFRSHLMPKRSFDTINSQMSSKGALYALAQESLSSASLSRPNPPPQRDGLLGKLSTLGRTRGNSSPSSPILSSQRPYPHSRIPPLPKDSLDSRTLSDYDPFAPNQPRFASIRPPSPEAEEACHPYANPDLVTMPAPPASDSSHLTAAVLPPVRNDSSITVTQKFVAEPSPYVTSRNSINSTTSGGRKRVSSVHGREISSPVAFQGISLPLEVNSTGHEGQPIGASHLAGWKEKFVPPAFSLISLEEARAQRAKTSAPQGDDATPTHSVADHSSQSTTTLPADDSSSTLNNELMNSRSRGRTTSAGAKAKNAFHSMVGSVITERRESEPVISPAHQPNVSQPPKALKHKKSGFMRIFNGGKDKEPDIPPPPVPSNYVSSDTPTVKRIASRVPVPSYIQPPLASSTSSQDRFSTSSNPTPSTESPRRAPPSLHINTVASNTRGGDSMDRKQNGTMTGLFAPKPWENSQPQSAPADVTGFPALKLRPTSGLFSSHFENIVPDFQTFSVSEFDTPSTGLTSPATPSTGDRFSKSDVDRKPPPASTLSAQRRINELEAQLRTLTVEVEELRSNQHCHQDTGAYCSSCGRGRVVSTGSARDGHGHISSASSSSSSSGSARGNGHSVLNRPRAKTSTNSSRFVNALA
ncbi:hypothetical protein DFP72DRAFT_1088999 [Ephemerocybe angulata]|uniref:Uncharacterized protein n=1 Tax=Ephemerocybe angulata TaxID=980116 RepID=A0A8H6IKQ8_9AGAR|nr:hypothetical protein DFP72DRAFT_1088999 [Tulosesus angulatus]